MTRYATDDNRSELLAIWGTGQGDVATVVTGFPPSADRDQRLHLAAQLTALSEALWRCYTHPASAADSLDVNTEGWRREQTRRAFADVPAAIEDPNLPQDRTLLVSYDPVEESAHRVGRSLHDIGDADLSSTVIAEVRAEIRAVEDAERGDLTDRARQAVLLTRQDASPAQIAAADQFLDADPFGSHELFRRFDPTAACVAAAHWLHAAAQVVAERSGLDMTNVVLESDNIEALPHTSPTRVLELLDSGLRPYEAVTSLIRDAMRVADGEVPDVDDLSEAIDEAQDLADQYADKDPETRAAIMSLRLTPLDPRRPAPDLLEDLLLGIRGCWLLYGEYADSASIQPISDADALEEDDPDYGDDDELDEAITESFLAEVRTKAHATRDELL